MTGKSCENCCYRQDYECHRYPPYWDERMIRFCFPAIVDSTEGKNWCGEWRPVKKKQ